MTRHRLAFGVSALLALQTAVAQIPPPTDAPRPLSPQESAAAFKLPDGFRMELVASEPLIASPSGVCWDERGRMFVGELHGYNLEGQLDIEELNKTGKLDSEVRRVQAGEKFKKAAEAGTYGVVKLLRDSDGDGRMDKAELWATNLPPAYGLVPARGGVVVACAPHIVFLADRDGDGRAEVHEKLFTGFRTGVLERGVNAPMGGLDGWIYFGRGHGGGRITGPHLAAPVELPGSDFRIRADGSAIEPVTGSTHTFGFAMTETGDRFVVSTTTPGIYVAPLPWRYLVRNPNAATPSIEVPTGDRRAYSISKPHPWRQRRADDPAYFKFYRDRYGASDSDAGGWFTSTCSPLVYLDHALPGLHGQHFVCEPSGNLIHRAVIEPDGSGLKLRRAPGEERSEFAASHDAWSHPMALSHGPDGAIWVVDFYREIIEDYSAIPRYLQQQYGLYAGHDRGRIYRLMHRDLPKAPSADMSALDVAALARECASPLLWRRATAQRLLAERGDQSAAPELRKVLRDTNTEPLAIITSLRTLDLLNALQPADVRPFLRHTNGAVRVHALQLGDRWFALEQGRELLEDALAAAAREQDARVLIQFALSLGDARDTRALAMLARFVREQLDIRWMDAAVLSSLAERGADMLGELLREPGNSGKFLTALAQSIAASGDETQLARAHRLLGYANSEIQAALREGLAKGRRGSTNRAKEQLTIADAPVSEETLRRFIAALAGARDLKRGHEVFQQACAMCHRLRNEGYEVGPDLLGQLGMPEESLLRDILAPSERIRPGYETTMVRMRDGDSVTGILKDDGATSLTLVQAGGLEQVLLRKDVAEAQRLSTSLMPPLAEGLTPADTANLLAWLKSIKN